MFEPHPPPGPHRMKSPILYKQVNHEMKEGSIMYKNLKRRGTCLRHQLVSPQRLNHTQIM